MSPIYVDGITELLTSGSGSELGIPVFGDRGIWDVLTSGSPGLHARDIYDGYPTYHLPDNAEVGQVPIWDGYKYVTEYVETAGSGGHGIHQHVEADILDLLHNATQIQGVPVNSGSLGDGQYLRYDEMANEWIPTTVTSGSGGDRVLGISVTGELPLDIIPIRIISPWLGSIQTIVSSLGVDGEAVGTDVVIDILKNGTSIFTEQANMVTILENELDDLNCVPDYSSFSVGDVFTFNVIERGTTKKASYLVLQIRVSIL